MLQDYKYTQIGPIILFLGNNLKEIIKNRGKNMHFRIVFKHWITNMIK